jgi:predicted RNA-binding Zn-ribbon protein involved in translation (DUF1610 family)
MSPGHPAPPDYDGHDGYACPTCGGAAVDMDPITQPDLACPCPCHLQVAAPMVSGHYYCVMGAEWMPEAEVETFNKANDGDGPELCPHCGNEVLWWSLPEARQYWTKAMERRSKEAH